MVFIKPWLDLLRESNAFVVVWLKCDRSPWPPKLITSNDRIQIWYFQRDHRLWLAFQWVFRFWRDDQIERLMPFNQVHLHCIEGWEDMEASFSNRNLSSFDDIRQLRSFFLEMWALRNNRQLLFTWWLREVDNWFAGLRLDHINPWQWAIKIYVVREALVYRLDKSCLNIKLVNNWFECLSLEGRSSIESVFRYKGARVWPAGEGDVKVNGPWA